MASCPLAVLAVCLAECGTSLQLLSVSVLLTLFKFRVHISLDFPLVVNPESIFFTLKSKGLESLRVNRNVKQDSVPDNLDHKSSPARVVPVLQLPVSTS